MLNKCLIAVKAKNKWKNNTVYIFIGGIAQYCKNDSK